MAPRLHLKVICPEEMLFQWYVDKVVVPTEDWELALLPGHISLVAVLGGGKIIVYPSYAENENFLKTLQDDKIIISIQSGTLSIDGESITMTVHALQ